LIKVFSFELFVKEELKQNKTITKSTDSPSETNSESQSSYRGTGISLTIIKASKNKYLPTDSVQEKEELPETFM
jgi:hypothetical protein